ncbi:dentin sialophosphoprotein precursor, putative [Trichomonas vaginalis G3]|uniref:Dentin sialophosphoprotein, putative n=1 Tax=Trichomonas vaginalis (strain ATCC PRA-98 / G3) TaxID=412133 RepID=A2DPF4_TRIV3|nr:hypothetical protein TVAGG3_0680810 [Trichomonas vaginalis G3]EAY17698.1 dentin sialophosphoprotein precursor, putative [Trichomonas vaginalis G3]KAI5507898.1 hypothetical protein TVAGG3_0680810 [Trichomonas vaginalis G3]|eukprot:XP_001329833.1 dentin sialophosphoprotein precursor [Trichomonas vaginalis G3]
MYTINFAQSTAQTLSYKPVTTYKSGPSCLKGALQTNDQKTQSFSWMKQEERVVLPYGYNPQILSKIPEIQKQEPIWPKIFTQNNKENQKQYPIQPVFRFLNLKQSKKNLSIADVSSDDEDFSNINSFPRSTKNTTHLLDSDSSDCEKFGSSSLDFSDDSTCFYMNTESILAESSPNATISNSNRSSRISISTKINSCSDTISTNFSCVPSSSLSYSKSSPIKSSSFRCSSVTSSNSERTSISCSE